MNGGRVRAQSRIACTDVIHRQAHRHGHAAQVHPDERAADVHARCSFDFLNEHRVVKGAPAVGSPAAARVGLRDGRHDLIAVGLGDRRAR